MCHIAPRMARCIDHSFLIRRSNFLQNVCRWEGGLFRSCLISLKRFVDKYKMAVLLFIIYPNISIDMLQSPSPAAAFFRLTESLISLSTAGYMSLRGAQYQFCGSAFFSLVALCQAFDVVRVDICILEAWMTWGWNAWWFIEACGVSIGREYMHF